ncbi:MAG TPA: DedA family protein [Conexibacter sp.]|nr:DedA family protein [Conexibacter sp.]
MALASIAAQVTDAVAQHGILAVFVLMGIDALLPVGGELVMLYAGVLAAGAVSHAVPQLLGLHPHVGLEAYLVLTLAGTVGYLLGSLAGWAIGLRGGRPLLERHGRWLHLPPPRLARAERWFDRFGPAAVFLGRLTPLVRSFISIPAGVFRVPLAGYTALTFAGGLIWCAAFAGAGWALGDQWEQLDHAFRYVDVVVAAAVVGGVVLLLVRRRQTRRVVARR